MRSVPPAVAGGLKIQLIEETSNEIFHFEA